MKRIYDNMHKKMHSFYRELEFQLESSNEYTHFYNLHYMDYRVTKISEELYDQIFDVITTRTLLFTS